MIHTLDVVEPGVDLSFDNGFKVGLHLCAVYSDGRSKRHSDELCCILRYVRSVDSDLVIFDGVRIFNHSEELAGRIMI